MAVLTERMILFKNDSVRSIIHDGHSFGVLRGALFHCAFSSAFTIAGLAMVRSLPPVPACAIDSVVMASEMMLGLWLVHPALPRAQRLDMYGKGDGKGLVLSMPACHLQAGMRTVADDLASRHLQALQALQACKWPAWLLWEQAHWGVNEGLVRKGSTEAECWIEG